MPKFSTDLLNLLSEYLVCEIGSSAVDGITYVLETNKEKAANFMKIREEADKCGYGSDEIFRVYEVSNGHIFDMDLSTAKKITLELSKSIPSKSNDVDGMIIRELIGKHPDERRASELKSLASYIDQEMMNNAAEKEIEVEIALFNKNAVDVITVTGVDDKGNKVAVRFKAYALRHWDIELLNKDYLATMGYKVLKLSVGEILPSKRGVRCVLDVARVAKRA